MTFRTAGDRNAPECSPPHIGEMAETDVWEETVTMHDGGLVTHDYRLVIAAGIPFFPEADVRRN